MIQNLQNKIESKTRIKEQIRSGEIRNKPLDKMTGLLVLDQIVNDCEDLIPSHKGEFKREFEAMSEHLQVLDRKVLRPEQ